ncbi:F0F1 ATP synthase subunit A [Candidatus Dojkabacteria bacterium]|uniref:ATP synthase subunit a n=1 Tax=Candidatus Dojkabacteria bacterium TaxID=2099670 RepID=A0A955LAN1_9BACT|nr:F0F1 ATP synthase subunit A [Candidatus Dojkabacteria bacterium]
MNNLLSVDAGLPSVPSDILFNIGGFPISNSMLSGILLTILLILFCGIVVLKTKSEGTPGKFQIILETLYELFFSFIESVVGNRKVAEKIFPIIGTIFIYIGISNILTLIPGIDSLTYRVGDNIVPLFRTHTSDINTTFGIAAAMILWTQIYSIKETSILVHLNKYFKVWGVIQGFRKSVGDGFIAIIEFFVGLLDIISEFAKSVSLSLRLFGNMFAGLMLSGIILGALAIIAPIPLILFGFFSGTLQALVFGALTASYFGSAAEIDSDER